MRETLESMRSTLIGILIIVCLINLVCLGAFIQHARAAETDTEESSAFTTDDASERGNEQGEQSSGENKAQGRPNVGVITLTETLELVIEDANKNALAGAIVDILYSGEVAGSGATGSDGRMTFTGLTKGVSFVIAASHPIAGEATLEYDGAVSGFDDLVVLTLPEAMPTGFFARLMSNLVSTQSRVIAIALLAWSMFDIIRIIIIICRYLKEKLNGQEWKRVRVELLDGAGVVRTYKYAKRRKN